MRDKNMSNKNNIFLLDAKNPIEPEKIDSIRDFLEYLEQGNVRAYIVTYLDKNNVVWTNKAGTAINVGGMLTFIQSEVLSEIEND